MAGRALTIDITTRDQQTLAALKRVQKELSAVDKAVDKTAKESDKLGRSADEYAAKLANAREVAGGIVLGGTAALMGKSIKDASDLSEAAQANVATFGAAAEAVERYAASASKIGISNKDALEATSTFGALFVQLGVGAEEAAGLSTELTTLAADFGSFKNADVTEVINAQAAAFRGEYDALQRFVPTINAAAVEQRAMAETGKTSAAALTLQEKALATYSLMVEGAGPAMGDFARNQDSAANSTKRAAAEMANTSASMGESLVPVYTQAAKVVGGLAGAFGALPGPAQTALVGVTGLTLGVGLLAPKALEGARVMQMAGQKAVSMATEMAVPSRAINGMGSALDSTTPKVGKLGVAFGALGAIGAAAALYEFARASTEIGASASDALSATNAELERLVLVINEFGGQGDFERIGRENVDALYAMRDAATAAGIPHPKLAAAIKEVEADAARASERTDQYAASERGAAGATEDLAAEQKRAAAAAQEQSAATQRAEAAVDGLRSAEEAVTSAQAGVISARDQLADSERGVAEARKGVADAAEGVRDAEKGLADASREAAVAADELAAAQRDAVFGTKELEDAHEGVADAEKDLADAQKDSLLAQEDLTAARERAAEVLEDLAVSAKGAVLDEREAILDLKDAREALAAGPDIDEAKPGESADAVAERERRNAEARKEWAEDRERLQIRVERAEMRLAEAQERNGEAADELAEAQARGIEQSEEVTAARDAIAAAADAERTAEEALAEAKARVVEVQEALAQRVVDAQARVVEANDRVTEAAGRVRDAQDQAAAAQQRVVDQQAAVVESRAAVEGAERKVTDALVAQALAQSELDTALANSKGALDGQIAKLLELAGQMEPGSPVRQRLLEMAEQLNSLTARPWTIELQTRLQAVDAINRAMEIALSGTDEANRGGRAIGGRVGAGRAYPVGENGPEILRLDPGESGRVFTPEQWAVDQRKQAAFNERDRRGQAKAAAGPRTLNVTINEAATPWATVDLIDSEFDRLMRVGVSH